MTRSGRSGRKEQRTKNRVRVLFSVLGKGAYMPNRFLDLLTRGDGPIVADGGMGTMLMAVGLLFGDPPEQWNVLPDKQGHVRAVHRGYLDAGAQIILTNSFGGNPFRLKLHNLHGRVFELNRAAAE